MPTSVHLPEQLLKAVDRKARALKMSRNQLVVRALEREVREVSNWSPGFFEQFAEHDSEISETVDDMVRHVRTARLSKPARAANLPTQIGWEAATQWRDNRRKV